MMIDPYHKNKMTKSNYYITIANKNVNGYTITLKYIKKGVIFIFTCNNSLISLKRFDDFNNNPMIKPPL